MFSPEIIIKIGNIISTGVKDFEELKLKVKELNIEISDDDLSKFGLKPPPVEESIKKSVKKPKEFAKIQKSLLECYMEAVSDMKKLKEHILVEDDDKSDGECMDDALIEIDIFIEKHTKNIKESEIWN